MADVGYDQDTLNQVQKLINAEKSDLFDVLEYIAYAKDPIERKTRVETAEKHLYIGLNEAQKEFINFVLGKYIELGTNELAIDNLPELLKFKYGTIPDALNTFGDLKLVQSAFVGFQKHLYGT